MSAGDIFITDAEKRIATMQARIDALEKEQAAWRMFTQEAEQTLAASGKKIARLLHEIERLKIDSWQDGTHPKKIDYGPNEV